jgi:RHS repeat-associated protein
MSRLRAVYNSEAGKPTKVCRQMRYRTFLLIVLLALSGVFLLDMRHYIKTALLFLPFLPVMLSAQPRAVDPTARYHRLICLVHLTGSGKHADPIRPEYVLSSLPTTKTWRLSRSSRRTGMRSTRFWRTGDPRSWSSRSARPAAEPVERKDGGDGPVGVGAGERRGRDVRVLSVWGRTYVKNPQDREKFATYTRESATGLDYADQRYCASSYGRFNSPDPYAAIGGPSDPGTWNRYSYTRGGPINRLDPRGARIALLSIWLA